jgi:hypothetical protein
VLELTRYEENPELPLRQRVENARVWFEEHVEAFREILQGQNVNDIGNVLMEIGRCMNCFAAFGCVGWIIEHGLLEIVFGLVMGPNRLLALDLLIELARANYNDAIELLRRGIIDLCVGLITADVPDATSAYSAAVILHRLIIGDIMIASIIYSTGLLQHLAMGLAKPSEDIAPAIGSIFLAMLSVIGVLLADLMYAVVDPRVKLE